VNKREPHLEDLDPRWLESLKSRRRFRINRALADFQEPGSDGFRLARVFRGPAKIPMFSVRDRECTITSTQAECAPRSIIRVVDSIRGSQPASGLAVGIRFV